MSIHISCDMHLRLGLCVQIRLYYVLPYKVTISAQHGIGFILDRCIVYLGLTMPNLQKKRLLFFEIFNIKKCTQFLEPSIFLLHFVSTPWCVSQARRGSPCLLVQALKGEEGQSQHFTPDSDGEASVTLVAFLTIHPRNLGCLPFRLLLLQSYIDIG